MTDVFEIPRLLEQEWKDWWTINDYIVQGNFPFLVSTKIKQGAGVRKGKKGGGVGGGTQCEKSASKTTQKSAR